MAEAVEVSVAEREAVLVGVEVAVLVAVVVSVLVGVMAGLRGPSPNHVKLARTVPKHNFDLKIGGRAGRAIRIWGAVESKNSSWASWEADRSTSHLHP